MLKKSLFRKSILILATLAIAVGGAHYMGCPNLFPRIMQKIPIPSTLLGPPKGSVTAQQYREKHPDRYLSIFPKSTYDFIPFPLQKEQSSSFTRSVPEAFVLTIEGGRVQGKNGLVITKDDRLLEDTAIGWGAPIKKHYIFRKNRLGFLKHTDETIAVIASRSADCYFHWVLDMLPRFELLKRSQVQYDKIYLAPLKFPFQKAWIARLGIDPDKIIWGQYKTHIQAKKLVIPSVGVGNGWIVPLWVCESIIEMMGNPKPLPQGDKLIYISRREAKLRKIINESECISTLNQRGFKEVILEELSLEEQAQLFATAECIVAPHGAGLTNLVFCRPGTRIIEIFSPNWLIECYWLMSQQLGLKHQCLLGSEEGLSEESKSKNDVYVSVSDILHALDTF